MAGWVFHCLVQNYVINLLLHLNNESMDGAFRKESSSTPCAQSVHLEAKGEIEWLKRSNTNTNSVQQLQALMLQTVLLKDNCSDYFWASTIKKLIQMVYGGGEAGFPRERGGC